MSKDFTHCMIVLHGFTMESDDMKYLTNKIDKILPKNVVMKYILPQAPKRKITIYKKKEYAWFDYFTEDVYTEEKIDINHLKESRKFIHNLINQEMKLFNDPSKIFLVGYSQGCCQMLDAGLTYKKKLGGLIGFKGHILSDTGKFKNYKQNIWVTHGTKDDAIGYNVAKESYEKYNSYDISFITLKNKNHDLNNGILEAIRELKKWISNKF